MLCDDCVHKNICYMKETCDYQKDIVYCKDCKHKKSLKCPMFFHEYQDNGFCHKGERIENE